MFLDQKRRLHKPRPLQKNGCIALTAPASPPDAIALEKGVVYLEKLGYRVIVGDSCTSRLDYLAGSSSDRAFELHHFFESKNVDAIFCARGGFGSLALLPKLDFDLIAQNPKLFVGFSDTSALQWALLHKSSLPSISGLLPAIDFCRTDLDADTENEFWNFVSSGSCIINRKGVLSFSGPIALNGISLPGTLSVVCKLLGTEYMPEAVSVLPILEDIGEAAHKTEGYLIQLLLSGFFDRANAILFGSFLEPKKQEYEQRPRFEDVLDRNFHLFSKPIIRDFPYGHHGSRFSLPVGLHISLSLEQNVTIQSRENLYRD